MIKLPPKVVAYAVCREQKLRQSAFLAVLQYCQEEVQKHTGPLLIITSIFAQLDSFENDYKYVGEQGRGGLLLEATREGEFRCFYQAD